jgi:hypothetical protein
MPNATSLLVQSHSHPHMYPHPPPASQPQAAAPCQLAAKSAAVLAVAHVRREWVFMNITPHITIRNKPWTVWGF